MKKALVILTFTVFLSSLFAVDYSEMSTQELIVIMGYVDKKNQNKFEKELKSRVPTMSTKERTLYKKNLKEVKNNEK